MEHFIRKPWRPKLEVLVQDLLYLRQFKHNPSLPFLLGWCHHAVKDSRLIGAEAGRGSTQE